MVGFGIFYYSWFCWIFFVVVSFLALWFFGKLFLNFFVEIFEIIAGLAISLLDFAYSGWRITIGVVEFSLFFLKFFVAYALSQIGGFV